MVKSKYAALVALCLTLCLTSAHAAPTVVLGSGNPAQDVKKIQDAVDQGGSVLLKGTFDFGPAGRVSITKDVRISGETAPSGSPKTVIRGGFWSFYAPLPVSGSPTKTTGPIVSVRDIRFIGAKGTPLHFAHIGGLDVRNVEVSKIVPHHLEIKRTDSDTLPFVAGVVAGPRLDHLGSRLDGAARGTIRIEDSLFDMAVDNPDETYGLGVMADWTQGADMAIRNNTILDASRSGIEALDNSLNAKGEGKLIIAGNRITTPDGGIAYPNEFSPNGVVVGWWISTPGGVDVTRNVPPTVTGNRIKALGDRSIGILLFANDVVVICNDINLGGGAKARGLVQTGSRGFFANNRVRGNGQYAVYCHPFEALQGSGNTFAWTNVNEFTPTRSQFYLDGFANVVVDPTPMVEDKGKSNRVVETPLCSLSESDPELDLGPLPEN